MNNGYNPSILQPVEEQWHCFICGRTDQKLDRHECIGGPFREKSKRYGLWVCLCHNRCHLYGVHRYPEDYKWIKTLAQDKAMEWYGWAEVEWLAEFGKNYH